MAEAGLRVRDLVDVPSIDTVVRLDERNDAQGRLRLLDSFVGTDEARRAEAAVGRRLREGQGSVFLLGGYGSGKSHLLAVLAEAGERAPHPAAADVWGPGGPPAVLPLAVAASLVGEAAARPLEEILLAAIEARVGAGTCAGATRPARWAAVGRAVAETDRHGLLVLVDELSAFLRAKPHRSALREDVRLLQYLGEMRDFPLCVVATMQETIEAAAQPEPEVSQRLRDRYATLRLSGAHLEEVVARRLLRPRPGAAAAVRGVRQRLVEALEALPCTPERFDRLYPVYPPTLEHLDAMRHHLSATRGALDFVYRSLVGDPDSGTPALLDRPADTLLTPDMLLDHFATRLRETPVTAPLVERVCALYDVEGARLFGPDAALAARIARLLCIEAAGARPRARTADELARALAVVAHSIDPGLARLGVAAVCERMVDAGAYVVREVGPDGAVRYRVDAEADAALVVERRLGAIASGAGSADEEAMADRLLDHLADEPAFPFHTLRREREASRTLSWERSERRGTIWYGRLEDLGAADVEAWLDQVGRPGQDFVLAIAAPAATDGAGRDRRHLEGTLLAAAQGRPGALGLLWWLSAPLADLQTLRRLDALLAVQAELEGVAGESSQRSQAVVAEGLREIAPRAARLALDAVFAGEVVLGQGDTLGTPQALRVLPFSGVVERLVGSALALRHPDHRVVMARGESAGEGAEASLYEGFFGEGEVTAPTPAQGAFLEGVVVPLGLAEKRGRGYRLQTDPGRSLALAALSGAMAGIGAGADGDSVATEAVRRSLAKGRLGLDARAIRLTVATAAFGGLVVPVSGSRRVPLGRLSTPDAVDRIERLRPGQGGETARVPAALARLPFLAEHADGPFLPAKQRELWARAVKWKAERGDPRAEAEALGELARHPVLAGWGLGAAMTDLAGAGALAAAIAVSLAPAEGLGRLADAAAAAGDGVGAALARAEAWSAFVRREVRLLLDAHRYLGHEALDALQGQGGETAALAAERAELRRRLLASPGLLDAGARQAWLEAFGRFVDAYRERYLRAHRSAVGEDPAPALAALERRRVAAAALPAARILRAEVLSRHCSLTPVRALDVDPLCTCGYRLGDPPLTQGIAAYADLLDALGAAAPAPPASVPAPVVVASSADAAAGADLVGAAAAAPDGAAVPPAAAPSDALAPSVPVPAAVQRRSLHDLAARLGSGGPLPAAELRRRFEAWLDAPAEQTVELDP